MKQYYKTPLGAHTFRRDTHETDILCFFEYIFQKVLEKKKVIKEGNF